MPSNNTRGRWSFAASANELTLQDLLGDVAHARSPRIADCWMISKAAGSSSPRSCISISLARWTISRVSILSSTCDTSASRSSFAGDMIAASLGRISLERKGLTRYATTPASRALSMSERWLNAVSKTTTVAVPSAPWRLDTVEARHLHVEQGQVGTEFANHRQRVVAAGRFAHDEVAVTLEDLLEIEPDDRLVVGDDRRAYPRSSSGVQSRKSSSRASTSSRTSSARRFISAFATATWRERSSYSWACSGVSETSARIRESSSASFQTVTLLLKDVEASRALVELALYVF